jgi:hypothetical protein
MVPHKTDERHLKGQMLIHARAGQEPQCAMSMEPILELPGPERSYR